MSLESKLLPWFLRFSNHYQHKYKGWLSHIAFGNPTLTSMMGISDQHNHVSTFQIRISVSGVDEDFSCKIIFGTLKGVSHKRIERFPFRSVTSYVDLTTLFVPHFFKNSEKPYLVVGMYDFWKCLQSPRRVTLIIWTLLALKWKSQMNIFLSWSLRKVEFRKF